MRKLFQKLLQMNRQGKDTVFVTVVAKSGSAPRGVGAHMLIGQSGLLSGTVGGGAYEGRAIEIARTMLLERHNHVEDFRLYPNVDKDLGMICGGEVTMHFQFLPGKNDLICRMTEQAETCFQTGAPCWLILHLYAKEAGILFSLSLEEGVLGPWVPNPILETRPIRYRCVRAERGPYYVERLQQPGRVYIFGGGHVTQALVPVLAFVDFRCVVVEDREEFCRKELFPEADETLLIPVGKWGECLKIGSADYVCIMTRGHQSDLECEAFALGTSARYIGVLGSRRKFASVNERLKERGFTEADLARVKAPIGLAIGSETSAEIAVSIAAQLIQVRAQG